MCGSMSEIASAVFRLFSGDDLRFPASWFANRSFLFAKYLLVDWHSASK
jgi:hypothetical protein